MDLNQGFQTRGPAFYMAPYLVSAVECGPPGYRRTFGFKVFLLKGLKAQKGLLFLKGDVQHTALNVQHTALDRH